MYVDYLVEDYIRTIKAFIQDTKRKNKLYNEMEKKLSYLTSQVNSEENHNEVKKTLNSLEQVLESEEGILLEKKSSQTQEITELLNNEVRTLISKTFQGNRNIEERIIAIHYALIYYSHIIKKIPAPITIFSEIYKLEKTDNPYFLQTKEEGGDEKTTRTQAVLIDFEWNVFFGELRELLIQKKRKIEEKKLKKNEVRSFDFEIDNIIEVAEEILVSNGDSPPDSEDCSKSELRTIVTSPIRIIGAIEHSTKRILKGLAESEKNKYYILKEENRDCAYVIERNRMQEILFIKINKKDIIDKEVS